jgi:N-acetyl-anhydromuramyl-L-alanine amidase AmpD
MPEYIVQPGNSLSGIAKRFGVPLGALIAANQITDPNRLKVGQKLLIPSVTTDEASLPTRLLSPRPVPSALWIDRKKFALAAGQFFPEQFPKDLIVLHFTAGQSARSAYDSWSSTPLQVATSYLVDVDGSIYECFPPGAWAYHLGVTGSASANWKHDKRSIGIEIANPGPLVVDRANPQQLNWWPGEFTIKWCSLADTTKYVAAPYRGFSYFAAFPAVQSDAVIALVDHLCQAFSIPKVLPPSAQQPEFDMSFFNTFKGIATHQNFRKDKTDVGPAFPLARLGNG